MKIHKNLTNALASPISGSLALRILALAASLALTITLTRTLSEAAYSSYNYALSFANMILLPFIGGMPIITLRETTRNISDQNYSCVLGIWLWANLVTIGAGIIAIIISVALAALRKTTSITTPENLTLAVILVSAMGILWTSAGALRGLQRIFLAGFSSDVIRPTILIVLIIATASFDNLILGADTVLAIHVGAAIAAILVSYFILRIAYKKNNPPRAYTKLNSRYWFSSLVPLSLSAGVTVIMANIDIVMLGLLGKQAEVGAYSVATRAATWASFGLLIINQAVQPRIAELYHKRQTLLLQSIVTRASRQSLISAGVIALIIFLLGKILLGSLFGEAYQSAYTPLLIITAGQIVNSFFGPVRSLLDLSGHERLVLGIMLITSALNVFLNYFLIPRYGSNGAALATAAGLMFWNALCWHIARKKCAIDTRAITFN